MFVDVPETVLVDRLSGRWLCESEKHVYHLKFNPPKKAGVCDLDGSPLHQRHDDERKTVERRIHEYKMKTAPLIDFYRHAGKLDEIDGTHAIEQVSKEILDKIQN